MGLTGTLGAIPALAGCWDLGPSHRVMAKKICLRICERSGICWKCDQWTRVAVQAKLRRGKAASGKKSQGSTKAKAGRTPVVPAALVVVETRRKESKQ